MLRAFGGRAATAPVSYLSQWRLLAPEAADDTAQICAARSGYVERATPRWTNSQIEQNRGKDPKRHFVEKIGVFEVALKIPPW